MWTMKFTQLAKSLKEGLAPVYVIEGEEAYFRDSAVAAIRSACALQNPMLNDARYEGENLKGEGLAALVRDLWTLPFLDGRRLVRACEFYPTEREWEGVLKAYCAAPCPSTVFLIVNGGKKAGAAQLSRKAGVVYVDCSREDEETLSRWLFGVARRAGLVMDADAAQLMVRYCARDAARMKAEGGTSRAPSSRRTSQRTSNTRSTNSRRRRRAKTSRCSRRSSPICSQRARTNTPF